MEFAQNEKNQSTENMDDVEDITYSQFCKRLMKKLTDKNITNNLDVILNIRDLKLVQYRITQEEYVIKLVTQSHPIYFHYDIKFEKLVKSFNNRIKLIPRIVSRDSHKIEVNNDAWIGNLLLEDIKNIIFLKNVAVIYNSEDVINSEINASTTNFIDYYPKFDPIVCNKKLSEVMNITNENIDGIAVKSYTCNIERLSYNVYQIDLFGFTEVVAEEDMEIYCEGDKHDMFTVRLVFDKNTNLVKVKSSLDKIDMTDYTREKLLLNDPSRVYYTNSFGEKFINGFLPYLKSSKSDIGCDFVQLIDHLFMSRPIIEVSYINLN